MATIHEVEIKTDKNGRIEKIFLDGIEIHAVTDVHINYITENDWHAKVSISFMAKVKSEENKNDYSNT